MNINLLLSKNDKTMYQLSKDTSIPYSTISDICNGKTKLENCNARTVYKLAKYFDVSMEKLIYDEELHRVEFNVFTSNMCHELKKLGYKKFILTILKEHRIDKYVEMKWFPEALYTLAMLDYISNLNNVPICLDYDSLRKKKLAEVVYPLSLMHSHDKEKMKKAFEESIPEFKRFNIVENDVFNII